MEIHVKPEQMHVFTNIFLFVNIKYFSLSFCVIVFQNVYCSVSMKLLRSQQNTNMWVSSVGFSFGNQRTFQVLLCPLAFWLSGSLGGNTEIILKNSGSLRAVVSLTDTFTAKGHLRSWFIWSVNVVVLQPCHPVIASTALLFYVVS